MADFEQAEQTGRLTFRRGGGWLTLFGLPFMAAGVLVIVLRAMNKFEGSQPPWLAIGPFGFAFFAAGAAVALGRAATIIDRTTGQVITWWGLLVPFRTKTFPLADVTMVVLSRRVVRTDKGSYVTYPVELEGAGGPVRLITPRDEHKAREIAENVAKFLGLGVKDTSGGAEVVREAGMLDESLRERVARTGEALTWPEPPTDSRIGYEVVGNEAVIDLPPVGFHPILAIIFIVGLVFPTVVMSFFLKPLLNDDSFPPPVRWIVVATIIVFFVLLPILVVCGTALHFMLTRERLTVSADALEVRRRGLLFTRTRRIAAAELEELGAGSLSGPTAGGVPSLFQGVTARSDRVTCSFGGGLKPAERDWLLGAIRYIVAGGTE